MINCNVKWYEVDPIRKSYCHVIVKEQKDNNSIIQLNNDTLVVRSDALYPYNSQKTKLGYELKYKNFPQLQSLFSASHIVKVTHNISCYKGEQSQTKTYLKYLFEKLLTTQISYQSVFVQSYSSFGGQLLQIINQMSGMPINNNKALTIILNTFYNTFPCVFKIGINKEKINYIKIIHLPLISDIFQEKIFQLLRESKPSIKEYYRIPTKYTYFQNQIDIELVIQSLNSLQLKIIEINEIFFLLSFIMNFKEIYKQIKQNSFLKQTKQYQNISKLIRRDVVDSLEKIIFQNKKDKLAIFKAINRIMFEKAIYKLTFLLNQKFCTEQAYQKQFTFVNTIRNQQKDDFYTCRSNILNESIINVLFNLQTTLQNKEISAKNIFNYMKQQFDSPVNRKLLQAEQREEQFYQKLRENQTIMQIVQCLLNTNKCESYQLQLDIFTNLITQSINCENETNYLLLYNKNNQQGMLQNVLKTINEYKMNVIISVPLQKFISKYKYTQSLKCIYRKNKILQKGIQQAIRQQNVKWKVQSNKIYLPQNQFQQMYHQLQKHCKQKNKLKKAFTSFTLKNKILQNLHKLIIKSRILKKIIEMFKKKCKKAINDISKFSSLKLFKNIFLANKFYKQFMILIYKIKRTKLIQSVNTKNDLIKQQNNVYLNQIYKKQKLKKNLDQNQQKMQTLLFNPIKRIKGQIFLKLKSLVVKAVQSKNKFQSPQSSKLKQQKPTSIKEQSQSLSQFVQMLQKQQFLAFKDSPSFKLQSWCNLAINFPYDTNKQIPIVEHIFFEDVCKKVPHLQQKKQLDVSILLKQRVVLSPFFSYLTDFLSSPDNAQQTMSHSPNFPPSSLLKNYPNDKYPTNELFNCILKIGKNKNTSKSLTQLLNEIVRSLNQSYNKQQPLLSNVLQSQTLIVNSYSYLHNMVKDEIFISFIKQIMRNPSEQSVQRLSHALCLLTKHYYPSPSFFYAFINYLKSVSAKGVEYLSAAFINALEMARAYEGYKGTVVSIFKQEISPNQRECKETLRMRKTMFSEKEVQTSVFIQIRLVNQEVYSYQIKSQPLITYKRKMLKEIKFLEYQKYFKLYFLKTIGGTPIQVNQYIKGIDFFNQLKQTDKENLLYLKLSHYIPFSLKQYPMLRISYLSSIFQQKNLPFLPEQYQNLVALSMAGGQFENIRLEMYLKHSKQQNCDNVNLNGIKKKFQQMPNNEQRCIELQTFKILKKSGFLLAKCYKFKPSKQQKVLTNVNKILTKPLQVCFYNNESLISSIDLRRIQNLYLNNQTIELSINSKCLLIHSPQRYTQFFNDLVQYTSFLIK